MVTRVSAVGADEVVEYFNRKADHYDEVDSQPYWQISDKLLWRILEKKLVELSTSVGEQIKFLDAGCGTARWALRILDFFPSATATLVDVSPDMLRVARDKTIAAGVCDRVEFVQADLTEISLGSDYDLVISFHNVLSFVANPGQVVASFHQSLKNGGVVAGMVPNKYHALHFSYASLRFSEVERIFDEQRVRFADDCPSMHVFSPVSAESLFSSAGFMKVTVMGFPISIYPSLLETTLDQSSNIYRENFADPEQQRSFIEKELGLINDGDTAARGNNLIVFGER